MNADARITAVLGPTNTGKTHYAIERMLGHRTGVIGLPLRLLAREVYDRIVRARGPSAVALVTGEERIVPERARYWVATVEAMPTGIGADFLAVDEIQLAADPERGHVFTDRLLHARGQLETMFLGAETMRSAIQALVPGVRFLGRDRFSTLTYTGARKISRLRPRSAVVGFSVENVYAIAELIRRQKGGAAVVMGALSPRTRNAQVALYQNGDVDYMVATDAIGMGLNLDISHVAFSSVKKFDGRRMRQLTPPELAQIAGRAGRHMTPGTFGVTGEARELEPEEVEAIEASRFAPVRRLQWRNHRLDFGSAARLVASLEAETDNMWLARARDADDLKALKALSDESEIADRLQGPADVRLLWDVCRIPDFRGISPAEHASLLGQIFRFLHRGGPVPDDWLAERVRRIDRVDGGIDMLSRRLAFIRTWTYVAQRNGWVEDAPHWRAETRAVEDRLSDALHERLTQRFVDRRTSVLMRRLKQKESLVADVNENGEVTVEGQFIGRIEGFRFRQDETSTPDEARAVRQASLAALKPRFVLMADRLYNAADTEFDITEQGGLMWGDAAVGKLKRGAELLRPDVEVFVDEIAGPEVAEKVRRRLGHFVERRIATLFEPLLSLAGDETLTGATRGLAYRLTEALGILPRAEVAAEVKALDQDARAALRKHGVRFGQFTIFMPALLKPKPTRLRLVLWSLWNGLDEFPEAPPPGLVTIPAVPGVSEDVYRLGGYRLAGSRAIRIDMLERLADMIRPLDARSGFEATADMLSITGLTLEQFADLMEGLGYRATRGERPKVRPAPPEAADTANAPEADRPANEMAETADQMAPDHTVSDDKAPDRTESPADIAADTAAEPAATSGAAATEAAEANANPDDTRPATEPRAEAAEVEVFYTFVRKPRGRRDTRPEGKGARPGPKKAGRGKGGHPGGKGKSGGGRRSESRGRKDRIDPDNPFAQALMGLKLKD